MKAVKKSRIATLMVHSSPLDQAGMGDAGGMNVYGLAHAIGHGVDEAWVFLFEILFQVLLNAK